MPIVLREAAIEDIPQIQNIRNSVNENQLSDPSLVTDEHCIEFITKRGKGWVCEVDEKIIGFAIADLHDNNVWALFLHPEYEGRGIGKQLHKLMLDWYFSNGKDWIWLSTSPGTRAEAFYRKAGYSENGLYGKNEIRFEMKREEWKTNSQ